MRVLISVETRLAASRTRQAPSSLRSRLRGRLRGWLRLVQWLRRRLSWRKALGDEINAFRILHFDSPVRHQLVRSPLRISRRPMDKPRAFQIARGRRQSSGVFAVLFDYLL